jgi:hypothetical protein
LILKTWVIQDYMSFMGKKDIILTKICKSISDGIWTVICYT